MMRIAQRRHLLERRLIAMERRRRLKRWGWLAVVWLAVLVIVMAMLVLSESVSAAGFAPESRAYEPCGAALELMYDRSDEVVLSGPAGTGKSRANLEKVHLLMLKYAGARGLITRQTRESLSESAVVTYENHVLPADSYLKQGPQRSRRQHYSYRNGSVIIVGGLDKPSKVMSTEFDIIYVQEGTELDENAWESLTTRLRNGVIPYQQLIADCNPGSPSNGPKPRGVRGQTRMLESRHEDNPRIHDRATGQLTPEGRKYMAKLDALTGVRKQRLRYGIWAQAEGMVYGDVWDVAVHVLDKFAVPKDWPRYWSVDFGFTNPFVWQCWAADGDHRLYRIAEIYRTKRLVEDHAKAILAWQKKNNEPDPVAVITDHDAEDRATLERYLNLITTPADKAVSTGIQATASRMKVAGDGKARLFLMRGALLERDRELDEAKLPCSTEEEIEGYIWDERRDQPVKRDDHGMDALRYCVTFVDADYLPLIIFGGDEDEDDY